MRADRPRPPQHLARCVHRRHRRRRGRTTGCPSGAIGHSAIPARISSASSAARRTQHLGGYARSTSRRCRDASRRCAGCRLPCAGRQTYSPTPSRSQLLRPPGSIRRSEDAGACAVVRAVRSVPPVLHHTLTRVMASLRLRSPVNRWPPDGRRPAGAHRRLPTAQRHHAQLPTWRRTIRCRLLNRRGTTSRCDGATGIPAGGAAVLRPDRSGGERPVTRGGDQFSVSPTASGGRRRVRRRSAGGDEFVIVLPGHDASAVAVAGRPVSVLAQPVHAEGRSVPWRSARVAVT
jgi:hypothetical protein